MTQFNPSDGLFFSDLLVTSHSLALYMDRALQPLNLSSPKMWLLTMLVGAKQPEGVTYLAECMNTTKSNVTSLVDRLEADGVVTRRRSDQDRRSVEITLTPFGHEQFEKGWAICLQIEQELSTLMSPAEKAQMQGCFQRIVEHLK